MWGFINYAALGQIHPDLKPCLAKFESYLQAAANEKITARAHLFHEDISLSREVVTWYQQFIAKLAKSTS